MIDNQRVTWTAFAILAIFFFSFFIFREQQQKLGPIDISRESAKLLENVSRHIAADQLEFWQQTLQGPFTLCVANNTLVIFSAISLSLFLLSLQPRKNDPSSSFHGFTFLEKRTIYHLSDYLPYPARVIISLIPSFSLLFFTSILNSRNLHLI